MNRVVRFAGLGIAIWIGSLAPAAGQINGPPIPPDQVLRSQPMPQTTVPPSSTVPSPGVNTGTRSTLAPTARPSRTNRVRDCQHQAAIDGVPRGQRGAYVHSCIQGN